MKTQYLVKCSWFIAAFTLLAWTSRAVDLLQKYPTTWVKGDTDPQNARAWNFTQDDVFKVSHFNLTVGDNLKLDIGAADLGIGHSTDGAVWAVLIPRDQGTLTSQANSQPEGVANVWLRFHPAEIDRLFGPDNVSPDGDKTQADQILGLADRKMTTSWQSGGKALLPEPKDMTVFVDTKDGQHRFFIVDTDAKTAEYVDAFNRHSGASSISAKSLPPVVVKTVPEAGSTDVPAGECEVKVTFSQEMTDASWSWVSVWQNSDPKTLDKPYYDTDHKTCVMKVQLEPGKTYGWWINSDKFHGFQNVRHQPAIPYLLTFKTAGQ